MVLTFQWTIAVLLLLKCEALRKGKFPSPPPPSAYCLVRNATCRELAEPNRYCLTARLSYSTVSTIFAEDSTNLTDVFEKLKQWSALISAPECWNVIQPFLCSVYMPKCENGIVERSSSELCQATRKPCQIVAESAGWPEFLQCEALHFQPGCYPLAARQKFNRTSTCAKPLVSTENPSSFFHGVKGCGIQCYNPVYSDTEHKKVHLFIAIVGTVCLLCTLFAILTFLIDWKASSKYPSVILFFVNVCFFLGSIGWLLQFSGLRDSIVCRKDGTMRVSEPKMNEGESAWCTVVFFMVYFFMMAGVMWFVALAFSWYVNFQALDTSSKKVEGKTTYFHVLAWTMPLILTIVVLAISEIEGDSLSGICFVGYVNQGIRAGLVLAPVGFALVFGLYFLIKGLVILIRIRKDCPEFVSDRTTEKIQFTIIRIGIFTFLACIFVVVSILVHIYNFTNEFEWKRSFKDFVICSAKRRIENSSDECTIESRPHLAAILMNIFTFFGAGIVMSSWVWTRATYRTWLRFIRAKFNMPQKDPVKMKQRQIARVFGQRREVESNCEASFVSSHEDPIDMDIDLYSASSRPGSVNMMRALPSRHRRHHRSSQRRAAQRRYSDSDIQSLASYMSRRMSGENLALPETSHRNNFYSRHHAEEDLDVRRWARQAARWTRRKKPKTKVRPMKTSASSFHRPPPRLHKRHEAAMERAARNSEVSSVISDGISEISSAVWDRNLPLPPIGCEATSRANSRCSGGSRKPDYSIFTASCFAPGELRQLSDPLAPPLPGSVEVTLPEPLGDPEGELLGSTGFITKGEPIRACKEGAIRMSNRESLRASNGRSVASERTGRGAPERAPSESGPPGGQRSESADLVSGAKGFRKPYRYLDMVSLDSPTDEDLTVLEM